MRARIPYAGYDGGAPVLEPASTAQPSAEVSALRDAQAEVAMLTNRLRQVEAALRAAAHVLQPYVRSSR